MKEVPSKLRHQSQLLYHYLVYYHIWRVGMGVDRAGRSVLNDLWTMFSGVGADSAGFATVPLLLRFG